MGVNPNLKGLSVRIGIHFRDGVIVHIGVDAELLYSGGDEETSRVLADYPHLEHTVHERDPIIGPREPAASAFNIATYDASEDAAEKEI